ncbi:hypothetical protein V8E55_009181 [Tylopilus felleus]
MIWSWIKWTWKLHLRAKHLVSSHIKDEDIPPLPENKSAVQVLADFMRYLFSCACNYIIESHASGDSMWRSLENNIEFILTHPNGWEGFQQQEIRHAVKIAGLIPGKKQHAGRIHLLTEGEASLHFCVTNMLASDSLSKFPYVSTNDLEEEEIDESEHQGLSQPREFKEIAPAECHLQGSVFITQRDHTFLMAKLANSQYGSDDIVQQMKDVFDKTTKLRFRDADDPQYIKFGTVRDKDPQYNIHSGQLKLSGKDVATFFEPSVVAIADAFKKQPLDLVTFWQYAFLVGGYAASDFLYRSLQLHPAFSEVQVRRPSSSVNKAVADGAVSSYIDPLVTSRTSRFTYGTKYRREHTQLTSLSGATMLPNAFASILQKGVEVSERQEFRHSFSKEGSSRSQLANVKVSILAYRGNDLNPEWMDEKPAHFTPMCNVVANPSELAHSLQPKMAPDGSVYYRMQYNVILLFGLTELKAQISWKHKRGENYSHSNDDAFSLTQVGHEQKSRFYRIHRRLSIGIGHLRAL